LLYNFAHHICTMPGLISAELRRAKCLARGRESQLR
jgi:hypothetical protein